MKNTFYVVLPLIVIASVLTGCTPSLVTDMFTDKYPPESPDDVRVFLVGEELPDSVLTIGRLKVVDGGLAVKGSYDRVLGKAVEATAYYGGNGLALTEHRVPDGRSTIHRVWGDILRLPQSVTDTLGDHSMERALARSDYDGYLAYKKQYNRYVERQNKAPRNIFRLSMGPSWLVSEYYFFGKKYQSKMGLDVAVDYEHVWKSGFGIGINYLYDYTLIGNGITMNLHYVGPSLVMALPFTKSRLDMALGLGYGFYSESTGFGEHSESHWAPTIRLGYEYRLGENIALGLQVNMLVMKMDKPNDVILDNDHFYGIQRVGVQTGIRYYF